MIVEGEVVHVPVPEGKMERKTISAGNESTIATVVAVPGPTLATVMT